MSAAAMSTGRPFRRRHAWLSAIAAVVAGSGALAWIFAFPSAPDIIEHPMLVRTDIPTVVDAGPGGEVWFTIEFSDAIGVFRNGRIGRISTGSQTLEPLGLAADGAGGAWYTDAPLRAISRISPEGEVRSYSLPASVVRMGRLAVAPGGAVWFADATTASAMRLQDGVFTRHDVGSRSGGIP